MRKARCWSLTVSSNSRYIKRQTTLKTLKYIWTVLLLLCATQVSAQRFFNLTAADVKVDSVLPQFSYALPLSGAYADSVYTVSISYPEFIDMTAADVARCKSMSGARFEPLPPVTQRIVTSRRRASLEVTFCPVVLRGGRYQVLVSFMLDVPLPRRPQSATRPTRYWPQADGLR